MQSDLSLTHRDISRSFDSHTIFKGERYHEQGLVVDLAADDELGFIEASVQGRARRPYNVVVFIQPGANGANIHGTCSCPLQGRCKHIVATLLEYLQGAEPTAPMLPLHAMQPAPEDRGITAWLHGLATINDPLTADDADSSDRIHYVVETRSAQPLPITAVVARRMRNGQYAVVRTLNITALTEGEEPSARSEDAFIGVMLRQLQGETRASASHAKIFGTLLEHLIVERRLHADTVQTPPLSQGAPLPARLIWELDEEGNQRPIIEPPTPQTLVLPGIIPWYIDLTSHQAGLLTLEIPPGLLNTLLQSPPVQPAQAQQVRTAIEKSSLALPAPMLLRTISAPPTPLIRLASRESASGWSDEAHLMFAYDDVRLSPFTQSATPTIINDDTIIKIQRDRSKEQDALEQLVTLDWLPTQEPLSDKEAAVFRFSQGETRCLQFVHRVLPSLRERGWQIETDPSFRHNVVEVTDESDWDAQLTENRYGWFDCEIGIQIDGERIALLPILLRALQRDPAEIERFLITADTDAHFYAKTEKGTVALPLARIRTILEVFLNLLDPNAKNGAVPALPLAQAAMLQNDGFNWKTSARLRELARKLASFDGITPVDPPSGLQASLRPYQLAGLSWLQFLREYGFGGVLADDMGLGKTVQTLAHLLAEKEAGRLRRPALLVVPTSLVPNWMDEAARFAPSLRTLSLHGPDRATRFKKIKRSDLVITTYPLLVRDEILLKQQWHIAILDEAQMVKNPASKGAQTVRRLRAEHRLCLTGTPIENHLGELWTQFDFLMPGTLGDQRRFTRIFRTPIEQHSDGERRFALSQRVRPFILRRTKGDVAQDLPEKTEMVRRVELHGDQRDLYETIRLAMHKRVRDEVAKRGLARSRIIILDALLKLRQACCDPRLVKTPAARKAKGSAKLTELRAMLPQLLEDGRRILLFSQFTSMLDLVEPELERLGIPYVQIRGTTKDRRTPVARFQAGEVPVFLISLKAGGTGLNLTAADTVIHLDPWWNPAVERQATDRAHRFGQKNNVFVYKLIAAGTVEERILQMQERKAAIAASLFNENDNAKLTLESTDLEQLFAPIDD